MHSTSFRLAIVLSIALLGSSPAAAPQATSAPSVPAFQSIGPLTFGADGVLFAADAQGAAIYAVTLGSALPAGRAGREGRFRRSTSRSRRCSAPTCARSR